MQIDSMLPEYSDEDLERLIAILDVIQPRVADVVRAYLELRFEMEQLRK